MWLIWNPPHLILPVWHPPSIPTRLDPTSSPTINSVPPVSPAVFSLFFQQWLFSHKPLCSCPERCCALTTPCSPFLQVKIWLNFLSSSSLVLSDHYSLVTMPVVLDHNFISIPFTLNITPKCEQHHPIPHHPHTGSTSQGISLYNVHSLRATKWNFT